MDLEPQLQILIEDAPNYGVPSLIMSRGVTPVLKQFSTNLKYPEYYLPQTESGDWVVNTLSNRLDPQLEKKVIYTFARIEDAIAFSNTLNHQVQPIPMFVTHILFQLFSTKQVDSIIFMANPGNFNNGIEVKREELQKAIQVKLKELVGNNKIDIA